MLFLGLNENDNFISNAGIRSLFLYVFVVCCRVFVTVRGSLYTVLH